MTDLGLPAIPTQPRKELCARSMPAPPTTRTCIDRTYASKQLLPAVPGEDYAWFRERLADPDLLDCAVGVKVSGAVLLAVPADGGRSGGCLSVGTVTDVPGASGRLSGASPDSLVSARPVGPPRHLPHRRLGPLAAPGRRGARQVLRLRAARHRRLPSPRLDVRPASGPREERTGPGRPDGPDSRTRCCRRPAPSAAASPTATSSGASAPQQAEAPGRSGPS